ncbi:MAG: Ig family protein, partial [Solirubrobacterales bacterium]|nr:Ig family protein [Solirubrobacterales bacterium]
MRLQKPVLALLTSAALLVPVTAAAGAQDGTAPVVPLPSAGGLAELGGPSTCAQAPDAFAGEAAAAPGCQTLAPLVGARTVLASSDGRFLYVAGGTDAFTIFGHGSGYGGLLVLARDAATGALTRVQCLSSDLSDGAGGGGCDPLTAAVDITGLALNPDGTAMALVASGSGALTLLRRDPESGRLTEVGCAQESVPYGGRCRSAPSLEGVGSVAFSPDGRDVYAASSFRSAITQLRAQEDGTLARYCVAADGASGSCDRAPQLVAPAGLHFSADGRFAYAATDLGVTWLVRDTATGRLAPGGCVTLSTGAACGSGRAGGAGGYVSTSSSRGPAFTPDGGTALVPADSSAVAQVSVLRREAADGSLRLVGCLTQTPYEEPDEPLDEGADPGQDGQDEAGVRVARPRQGPACAQAPVLPVGGAPVALTDGRFLITGYGTAAVVSVGADGTPAADGCFAPDDNRCAA